MKLDIVSHTGDRRKPAVIFIHGLGMDKNIWINPSDSRILGGMFPLAVLLRKRFAGKEIRTLFEDLRQRHYCVITWSQRRPAGPIAGAVSECREVLNRAKKMTESGIILVGHSRGGLIGRKYLLTKDTSVKGFLTISAPHKGSSVARISRYVSPVAALIDPLVPGGNRGNWSFAVKKTLAFLRSRALKELLPESNFFASLSDGPLEGVHYASVGGTNPTLLNIHNLSFPDIFEKVIPEHLYPEEMKKGRGDGLVSAESSKIPWTDEHCTFPFNHAEILFDKGVRDAIVKIIERIR